MCDLNLDLIRAAHAEDAREYRYTKASPQHLHRHWLLKYIEKLEDKKRDKQRVE